MHLPEVIEPEGLVVLPRVVFDDMQPKQGPPDSSKPPPGTEPGTHKIEFVVRDIDDDRVTRHEESSFIVPH